MSGRIPPEFINDLLSRTDIVSVIEHYISVKKVGHEYHALCPFHNEKTPSFTISPRKQFYYCFGCGAKGNAIGFVMQYEHLSFVDAVENLAQQVGVQVPREVGVKQHSEHHAWIETLEKVSAFYQQALTKNPTAKSYLEKRGLSLDIIQQFGIGYAPESWDDIIQAIGKSKEKQLALQKTGMTVTNEKGSTYNRFRNRIMFPIRDRRGRVIGFGGRVLNKDEPKYLNSPETPLFHKGQELYGLYEARLSTRHLEKLIVVEGYMDVIALAQHGVTYAVATLGTAITPKHIERLMRTVKSIVFCFDGDNAGMKAAWKALEVSLPMLRDDVSIQFLFMPSGKDPDDIIREEGQSGFEQRIEKAHSLTEYFFEHLNQSLNLETLEGRSKLVSQAMPYVQQIAAPVMKDLLLSALANESGTSKTKLENWSHEEKKKVAYNLTEKTKPLRQTPIRLAITLLSQQPNLALKKQIELPEGDAPGLKLLHQLQKVITNHHVEVTGVLLEYFREHPNYSSLEALSVTQLLIPESGFYEEWCALGKRIQLFVLNQKINELMEKMRLEKITAEERNKLHELTRKRHEFNK